MPMIPNLKIEHDCCAVLSKKNKMKYQNYLSFKLEKNIEEL